MRVLCRPSVFPEWLTGCCSQQHPINRTCELRGASGENKKDTVLNASGLALSATTRVVDTATRSVRALSGHVTPGELAYHLHPTHTTSAADHSSHHFDWGHQHLPVGSVLTQIPPTHQAHSTRGKWNSLHESLKKKTVGIRCQSLPFSLMLFDSPTLIMTPHIYHHTTSRNSHSFARIVHRPLIADR